MSYLQIKIQCTTSVGKIFPFSMFLQSTKTYMLLSQVKIGTKQSSFEKAVLSPAKKEFVKATSLVLYSHLCRFTRFSF